MYYIIRYLWRAISYVFGSLVLLFGMVFFEALHVLLFFKRPTPTIWQFDREVVVEENEKTYTTERRHYANVLHWLLSIKHTSSKRWVRGREPRFSEDVQRALQPRK